MKRIIDHFLIQWKNNQSRKPLLLRGARQIGKTYSVRQLGNTFDSFIEINLELQPEAQRVFSKDPNPHRILEELFFITKKQIVPGKTLLFLDEIQTVPAAITALRYFYELMPELHVIAAGSLLDFAINQVGVPVGRINSLFMYPLSFTEYLVAVGYGMVVEKIMLHKPEEAISEVMHEKLLDLLGKYLAIGGMPYALREWIDKQSPLAFANAHTELLTTYRQDFGKYARTLQIKYVELIFDQIPRQMGRKFKYSLVDGDYRKRELAPALDLLVTAGVAHKVHYSAGQGIPLGAQLDPQDYKALYLDIGLAQAALGIDIGGWFLNPQLAFVNKGDLVEAFVGQELIAYGHPNTPQRAFYWHKETGPTNAEIDYLAQVAYSVVPIEVKSGQRTTLRSIRYFLETHPSSSYGIRFSMQNYSVHENIHSYRLYAIVSVIAQANNEMREAIALLIKN